MKALIAVQVLLSCASSIGTSSVKYSVDGSTFTTVQSATNVSGLMTLENTRDTSDNELVNGREYKFEVNTTGNASILGIRYRYKPLNQLA